MSIVGIIAEFNPLHTGHEYLLRCANALGKTVCVISGNFVQRGDTAIFAKEIRVKSALLCGADLVAELPVLWSMSTAQNFALGGMSALVNLGCDTLLFGSEEGEIEPLIKTADILLSGGFSKALNKHLSDGITFAAARQKAAEELGAPKGILDRPNNNLGIEYIIAARRLGADLEFKTVKRLGADHDSESLGDYVSASLLRKGILNGNNEMLEKYIPQKVSALYTEENLSDISRIETGILSLLRTKTHNDLKKLPDLSEGVENKLYSAIRVATSLENLYNELKVKRYPLARIRRLVLSAALGFDSTFFMKSLPYVRVLGKSAEGDSILKNAKALSKIPIITKVSQISELDENSQKVFQTECKATDLFALSLKKPQECGKEYTLKFLLEE